MRVGIIGAGLAGLNAAVEAAAAGHEVVVWEARDRVGGRVWSQTLADGAVIERGAEFILDGYDLLREKADKLRLALADTGMSYYAREPRGGEPTTLQEMIEAGPALTLAAQKVVGARTVASVVQVLEVLPVSDAVKAAIAARASVSSAWPAEDLAADALADFVGGFTPRPSYRIAGGNQQLPVGLARGLLNSGGALHLGTPVTGVRWSDEQGATVVLNGAEHPVDAVIAAVPAAVLDRIVFDPVLPGWKTDALAEVSAGQAAKLAVPLLGGQVPASAVMSVPDRYWCWTATDGTGEVTPVLNSFVGSAPALEALRIDKGPTRWLGLLAALRPDLDLAPSGVVLTTWHDDPWARSAYSAHAAGRHPDADALAAAVGPVHFIGEYTDSALTGLMEGALRSGQRGAAELDQV